MTLRSTIAACTVLIGAPAIAHAADLPVEPRALVILRSQMPGFVKAKTNLELALTPGQWVNDVLEDTPANGEEEESRLIVEGFREGVREVLTLRDALGFSGALLLGSPEAAQKESADKASEELAELGRGATRFPVPAVPNAFGVQQTHIKHSSTRGLYSVSVVFSRGACMAGIGALMRSYGSARRAAMTGALALEHRLGKVCP